MELWERVGNTWYFRPLRCVTVQPVGFVLADGSVRNAWQAFCAGRPLENIPISKNSEEVKRAVFRYYDDRMELIPQEGGG